MNAMKERRVARTSRIVAGGEWREVCNFVVEFRISCKFLWVTDCSHCDGVHVLIFGGPEIQIMMIRPGGGIILAILMGAGIVADILQF
jgi:hypothetical protein